jgi:FMN phosphatase YigB (HAD superfamily)
MKKALIFDLGGVIVDIDDSIALKYLEKNGIKNSDKLFNRENDYCMAYETGKISANEFIDLASEAAIGELNKTQKKKIIKSAWLKIVVDVPLFQILVLNELAKNHQLHVLSNNNILHKDKIERICRKKYNVDFFSLFNKVHLSYQTGYLKPNPMAFNSLLSDIACDSSDCVFFDDREENITIAKQLGFEAYHVLSKNWFDNVSDEKLLEMKFDED